MGEKGIALAVCSWLVCMGCGPGATTTPPDGGSEPASCSTAADCDDEVFCNGAERCDPSAAGSDERGCVPAADPACAEGESCNEATDACSDTCVDADGDGEGASACGGSDCDDADPRRYAGATEVCDPDDVDEDCDPSTFGTRDVDDDGYVDIACCNGTTCGDDCDDTREGTHPDEAESCDAIDNDCDGAIDEGAALLSWYPDRDGDRYGDSDSPPTASCLAPGPDWERNNRDCDDRNAEINPGRPEITTDTIDNDCDGRVNEQYEVRAGIGPLGGAVAGPSLRVYAPRLEGFERVCGTERCVTGGIVSGDVRGTR